MLGIHKANLDVPRHKWLVLQIYTIAEGTFNLLTLGFFVVRWRSDLLFSDYLMGSK
jgi:hypothetical protein